MAVNAGAAAALELAALESGFLASAVWAGEAEWAAPAAVTLAAPSSEGQTTAARIPIRPRTSVEVLQRDDGPVVLYLFPRSKEITRQDKRIQFDARIGRLQLTQSFYPEDMTYQGKLEL